MALKDLLDGIENIGGYISGEYGKIGQFDTIDMETRLNTNDPESSPRSLLGSMNNPQSYQANGFVVTGQQSFERPLEEPLPIQEVIVGYGLRTSSQNFIEDTFANGFTADMTSTQFVDLGTETSDYNDSVSFGDVTYTFPNPVNFFDKAGENPYVKGFTKNTSPEGIGPSSDTDFLVVNGESSTFNPTINSFTLDNTDSIFQSNLFIQNSLGFTGISTSTAFRRQAGRIDDWNTTPSNFISQDDVSSADITSNADYMTAHSATITTIDNQAGSVNLNLSAGRTGNQYPDFFTENSIFDGDGNEFTINPNRLEQFAIDRFKGAGTDSGENRVVIVPVNSDGTAAANPDVRQQLSDENQKGFRNYIQEMSPGKNSPFIVKKIGSSYGLGDLTSALSNADLTSGTGLASWLPAVADFAVNGLGFVAETLDNVGGGFVRGTPDTISGRVHREIDDALRKGKFILSGKGLLFGLKQFGLQLVNRTIETRVYNPISLFSTDFYHKKRHALGIEYEDLMKDPVKSMKDAAPSFIEPILEPIFTSLFPTIGDGKSTSRTALQVRWVDNEDAPFEQYAQPSLTGPDAGNVLQRGLGRIRNAVVNAVNGVLNKGTIALHNPNHYFRIGGVVDPYRGPDGSGPLEDIDNILTKATTPGQGATTFYKKTKSLEEQYNNYAFKTYGQIKDAASKDDSRNIYSNAKRENLIEKAPINPVADVEIHSGIEAQMAEDYKKEARDYKARLLSGGSPLKKAFDKQERFYSEYEDRVNSRPLVPTAAGTEYDFIDFYFKTFQWKNSSSSSRYLQFSAVINNLNESVTPEYSEARYLGRPNKYYIYNGVDRDVSLEFTLYPHSKEELPFLMEKLNYLIGLCYPQYNSNGFMISPNVELTIGDMFRDQPGYVNQLSVNVQDNTTWEMERFQFPKHITANLTFRYFGKHVPHQFGKHYDIPYLTPFKNGDGASVGKQEVGALGFESNFQANKDSANTPLYKKSLTRRTPTERFGTLEQDIIKIGNKSAGKEIVGEQ